MANAKYLKVSDVGTAVETAISAYTGNANEIINTNGSGKVDSTLIDFPVSNENFEQGTHSGLDFEVLEGEFTVNNNILIEVAQNTLTLTDDALNYIGVTPAGAFAVNTTGFADFVYPLYTATTLSGAITLITDLRRRTNLIDIIDDTATTETDVTLSANQINTIVGAVIDDTETTGSLTSTYSSSKILSLIEKSRIIAVSKLVEFQNASNYFANLPTRGGIILVTGEIEISADITIDLRGITVIGTGGGFALNVSKIKFSNDAKLTLCGNTTTRDSIIFQNLKFEGDVTSISASQTKPRFVVNIEVSSLIFDNCHFKNLVGIHTNVANHNSTFNITSNPLFEILCTTSGGVPYSPLSVVKILNLSISHDLPYSGSSANSGISFGYIGSFSNAVGIRGDLQFFVSGIQPHYPPKQKEYSRIIISNKPLRTNTPADYNTFTCLDNYAVFQEPDGITSFKNMTSNLTCSSFIDYNFNYQTNLPNADLAVDDEILIYDKSANEVKKVTLADLKTYITTP
jgi:hypothetical protein